VSKRTAAAREQAMDEVDVIIAAWERERPDLDVTTVGVVSRVTRLAARFTAILEATFAAHGLTKASFEAIAALRRAGAPYRMSQTTLMQALSLTPGTVSVRIDRLVAEGLVVREPHAEDRRSVLVRLTPRGEEAFDDVVGAHLETERRLLGALTRHECDVLAGLLRRLVLDAQQQPTASRDHERDDARRGVSERKPEGTS
jgi:DNA-binding MarR family transcriptional regulator